MDALWFRLNRLLFSAQADGGVEKWEVEAEDGAVEKQVCTRVALVGIARHIDPLEVVVIFKTRRDEASLYVAFVPIAGVGSLIDYLIRAVGIGDEGYVVVYSPDYFLRVAVAVEITPQTRQLVVGSCVDFARIFLSWLGASGKQCVGNQGCPAVAFKTKSRGNR